MQVTYGVTIPETTEPQPLCLSSDRQFIEDIADHINIEKQAPYAQIVTAPVNDGLIGRWTALTES
jgi:hypothetical protein